MCPAVTRQEMVGMEIEESRSVSGSPAEILVFLGACAIGNAEIVEQFLRKGLVSKIVGNGE